MPIHSIVNGSPWYEARRCRSKPARRSASDRYALSLLGVCFRPLCGRSATDFVVPAGMPDSRCRPDLVSTGWSGRMFVVEQRGLIRIVKNGAGSIGLFWMAVEGELLRSAVAGSGVFAFVSVERTFYINYTDPQGNSVVSGCVSRPPTPIGGSEFRAGDSSVTQPFANHNGGNLVFGPDGYLYSVSAMGVAPAIRRTTRSEQTRCWVRYSASTWNRGRRRIASRR